MCWNPKRDIPKQRRDLYQVSTCQGGISDCGGECVNLNRYVLSWLLRLEMACWDLTISGSLLFVTSKKQIKSSEFTSKIAVYDKPNNVE